jgi:single-strand DNA-binding protein
MYDSYITVLGNVLTKPEWRQTKNTGVLVANFRIASTARRYDKATDQWTDGDSLRVRVNCWRKLAEGVTSSVAVGDPVIVLGRMVTREWLTEANERRISYELEAVAVGHDLGKGRAKFERKRATATSTIEDAESEARVGGELTEPVHELNMGPGFDDFDDLDSLGDLGTGFSPLLDPRAAATAEPDESDESEDGESEEGDEDGTAASGRRGRRRTREPVPA